MEWNEHLATGYEEIDNQHRELINRMNYMVELCNREEQKEVICEALDSWGAYTIDHFRMEETMQREQEYPHYPVHRDMHDNMVRFIQDFYDRLEEGESLSTLTMQLNSSFVQDLTRHFFEDDCRWVRYIKERNEVPVM